MTAQDAYAKIPNDMPPFRVTLSPARDMEGTSYESRFFIFEGGEDLAARRAIVIWLFESDLGRPALEELAASDIVIYTREGVKIEHCSFLRPNDELLVSIRAPALRQISENAMAARARSRSRKTSHITSQSDDADEAGVDEADEIKRASSLTPALGGAAPAAAAPPC